jgi:hypothetical protein
MYSFEKLETDRLTDVLVEVLKSLQREHKAVYGKRLTQKKIAAESKVDYFRISKSKGRGANQMFSKEHLCDLLKAISDTYKIIYTAEGEVAEIGFFKQEISPQPKEELCYYYYYLGRDFSRSDEVKKAILRLNLVSQTVSLTLYHNNSSEARMRYSGTVKLFPRKEFYLIFNQRQNLISEEKDDIPAMCCFSMSGSVPLADWHVGIFTGTETVTGICVLELAAPSGAELELASRKTPPLVAFLLGHHRIEAEKLGRPFEINNALEMLDSLQAHEGVYEAYLVEGQTDREVVHRLVFEIYDRCRIRFNSKYTEEQHGLIRQYLKGKIIVSQFSYRKEEGYYDFNIILDAKPSAKDQEIPPGYMLGVYGGIEQKFENPIAGRILLKKAPPNQTFDRAWSLKIPLKDEAQLKAHFAKEPLLKKFLRGELDRFVDSLAMLESYPMLSQAQAAPPNQKRQIKRLAGVYQIYHLSSDKKHIHHSPIEIFPNGDVIIVDQTEEEKRQSTGHKYFGRAHFYMGNFLAIAIEKRDDEDYFAHLSFYVASLDYERVAHFHGVSTSITRYNTIRASREVMIKIGGTLENAYSRRIPIPLEGKIEPLYEELDKTYQGLATFLTGNAHNLIIPRRDPDAPFERNENYGMVYFSSACYFAANNDPANARKQLERAFQHGFRDRNLLKKEMSGGMLSNPEIRIFIDADRLMILS